MKILIIAFLLASAFQDAHGTTSVSAAEGLCGFASLGSRAALGSFSERLEVALGEPTIGQFEGERSWGVAKADFARIGFRAEGVDQAVVRTFKGRVFALEMIYDSAQLDHWRRVLRAQLGLCAKLVAQNCWEDIVGGYYILVDNSAGLMLAYGDPALSASSEREGPARCRSGSVKP